VKIAYDAEADTLTISFRDEPVRESEEKRSGVILDYAADGSLVGLEILDASRRVPKPTTVEIEVVRQAREHRRRNRPAAASSKDSPICR
jgi:uncharacterized protein YuzE